MLFHIFPLTSEIQSITEDQELGTVISTQRWVIGGLVRPRYEVHQVNRLS
jgi:hypothetical protein